MKAALLLLSFWIAFIGNSGNSPHSSLHQKKSKADIAMDKVADVPEVMYFLKKNQAQKAILLLQGEPTKDRNYYWISLGISNAERFRPTEHFYVNPDTLQVFYLDIFISQGSDEILTLKKWRQLRKTAGWKKMHYYKNGKLIVDAG